MVPYLLTAQLDGRAGHGRIASRIGIGAEADTFRRTDDLFAGWPSAWRKARSPAFSWTKRNS